MKTYNFLYPEISSFSNLYPAWRKARRGKRYKATVAAFERNLDVELTHLYAEMQYEVWQPGGYRHFTIHEPKRRKISAAPFRDRVVHHALVRVIEPLFDQRFIDDSYANRKGKGTHKALDRWMCEATFRKGTACSRPMRVNVGTSGGDWHAC